jgi:integrase
MPKPQSVPSYRLHKATGQAVVVLKGRSFYLGKFGSHESKAEYRRVISEFLTLGGEPPPAQTASLATPDLTIDELMVRYWAHVEAYYVRDGVTSREQENIKDALRHVRPLYGPTPAARFGPLALKAVRESMIAAGLSRQTINYRVGKVRRMFRWGMANELVTEPVYRALMGVEGLRKGNGQAKEKAPIAPVAAEVVEATLPYLTRPVAAMVRLQMASGMRPGEARAMRADEIDRSGEVWIDRPSRHKTEGHGRGRAIPLGPKAQEVIRPFLEAAGSSDYLFSPRDAAEERNEERRRGRVTPMTPSQAARKRAAAPKRMPGACYGRSAYLNAIWKGCDKAFPHPTSQDGPEGSFTTKDAIEWFRWRRAHRWHPNQLRHALATEVRARFGLEAAQAVLGHARADVTQVYAERDLGKAVEVMRQIG